MMYAEIDRTGAVPRVSFPRTYNAAADLVTRHVEEGRGTRVAVTDDRESLTYAALDSRVNRAGNALLALGVRAEERVMMVMLDTVDFHAVFLGALKIGAVPVPVNTLLTPVDYAYLLADSRARVLVVSDAMLAKCTDAIAACPNVKVLAAETPLGGDRNAHARLEDALMRARDALTAAPTTPDDPAFWLYSSGSTGKRRRGRFTCIRIVMWTVGALRARGAWNSCEDDVVLLRREACSSRMGSAMRSHFRSPPAGARCLCVERPTLRSS